MSTESTTCDHTPQDVPNQPEPPAPPSEQPEPPIPPSGGVLPPAYKPRPKDCIVCRHNDRETIDNLLAPGEMSMRFLALRFKLATHRSLHDHKKKCWPSKQIGVVSAGASAGPSVPPAVPAVVVTPTVVSLTSPTPEVEQSIRKREDRIRRLDALWLAGERLRLARAKAYAHVPGGDTGLLVVNRYGEAQYDHAFVRAQLALHEAASKETGEWLEQQGRVVSMPTQDAPVVIVIGGGSFRPPADPRSVPSARPRVEFPRGAPRSRIMAEARLAETDIEIGEDAREDALPGIRPGGEGGDGGQG